MVCNFKRKIAMVCKWLTVTGMQIKYAMYTSFDFTAMDM